MQPEIRATHHTHVQVEQQELEAMTGDAGQDGELHSMIKEEQQQLATQVLCFLFHLLVRMSKPHRTPPCQHPTLPASRKVRR